MSEDMYHCSGCGEVKDAREFASEDDSYCALCFSRWTTEAMNGENDHFMFVSFIEGFTDEEDRGIQERLECHKCAECGGMLGIIFTIPEKVSPLIALACRNCSNRAYALFGERHEIIEIYEDTRFHSAVSIQGSLDIPF